MIPDKIARQTYKMQTPTITQRIVYLESNVKDIIAEIESLKLTVMDNDNVMMDNAAISMPASFAFRLPQPQEPQEPVSEIYVLWDTETNGRFCQQSISDHSIT